MRKTIHFKQMLAVAILLFATSVQAQGLKDLLNKENIEKAVNTLTGKNTASMTGTWEFSGAALEFESDNLLQKAGGSLAATAVEKKLDGFLEKVGIEPGQMSFTFNEDSTFQTTVKGKNLKGNYSYDEAQENHPVLSVKTDTGCASGRYIHSYTPLISYQHRTH